MDSIVAAGYQGIANCQTISELQIYLQKIATLLNDGHTAIFPNYNMNAIYPFQIFFDKDDVYLRAVNKEFESTLGKKIVKINNSPVLAVIDRFKSAISNDNDVYFRDKVKNQMQFFSTWEGNPHLAKDSTLALTFADNSTALIKPVTRTQLNIVSANSTFRYIFE